MADTATDAAARAPAAPTRGGAWTARRFFDLLGELGPLRVISICGPSVFESLCTFGPYGVAHGHMNAITPAYHWHVDLARFRRLRTRDEVHDRSGRRVLYFELYEEGAERPFVLVYLYREKRADFEAERLDHFAAAHAELAQGAALADAGEAS